MALTNTQYDTIMQEYNRRRLHSKKILEERIREIYEKLPAYKDLDELTASIAVSQGKKKLSGEITS